MKPLKHSRTVKSPKDRSPVKKWNSRKSGSQRSPPRSSTSGRPSGPRGLSPASKHGSPRRQKVPLSPRPHPYASRRFPEHGSRGSPMSMERLSSSSRVQEYEKRRRLSHSPDRRISGSSSGPRQRMPPPPPPPQMMRARSGSPRMRPPPPLAFDVSPKKKLRREAPPLPTSSHRPMEKLHISHPSERSGEYLPPPDRGRVTYQVDNSRERYSMQPVGPPSHPRSMISAASAYRKEPVMMEHKKIRDDYLPEKSKNYGLTLDERFRSVGSDVARMGPDRVQYSREELENITIDIKRNFREYSPTVRRIVNPSEVKLVRRPGEGHRPIFDREEIKQAPHDLREDAYFEQKLYAATVGRGGSGHYVFNYKEMENYEITRHKFDNHHAPPMHDSPYTLSEKWRRLEHQKQGASISDRDEGEQRYPLRLHASGEYLESRRSRSSEREYRPAAVDARSRRDYSSESRRMVSAPSADLRRNLDVRHKEPPLHDSHRRITERRGSDDYPPEPRSEWRHISSHHPPERNSSDRPRERSGSRTRGHRGERSRGSGDSPWRHENPAQRPRYKEGPPDPEEFAHKSGRFKFPEKPHPSSRTPGYFQHDDRGSSSSFRSGSRSPRGFRSRGFRGRFFRGGPPRGGFRGRPPFRGNPSSRGRGFPPRRKFSGFRP